MTIQCDEQGGNCKMEERFDTVVERFSKLADKLSDNQIELRMSVVKLTENMHELKRVHERVDVLEEDIKKITPLVYKMVGVVGVVGVLTPLAVTYILKL